VPQPRKPGSKRAKLFVLVDDYSRLLVGARWMEEENTSLSFRNFVRTYVR
jgi:hypothetical protein